MSQEHAQEIAAHIERADQSLSAAVDLQAQGYCDFAASRAYYAAFYAATSLLLYEGLEFGKHSGVVAAIHQRFVKTGKLTQAQGKNLNWLFELRSVGDYGGATHVTRQECEQAIRVAQDFVSAIKGLLQ